MTEKEKSGLMQGNRRWVWLAVIGLWVMGCVILAVGGGWFLGQRNADHRQNESVTVATEPTSAAQIILSTPVPPVDTATPAPTDTPVPRPTATNGPSLGDRISLPTATPTPIPEGVIVFLSSRNYDPQSEPCNRKHDLFAMNLDGSNQVKIDIPADPQQLGYYGIYPYYKPYQIVDYSYDGMSTTVLILTVYDISQLSSIDLPLIDTNSEIKWAWTPSWSKTGDTAFAGSLQSDEWVIYFLDHNQTKAKQLTFPPNNLANEVYGDTFPVWSPNGEWIAYTRTWYQSESDGVWLMRPDGSDAHRIIEKNTRAIAWSPDGTKIAFQGRPTNDGFDIWVADADGNNQKQLSFFPVGDYGTYDFNLVWSPDSKQIIFQLTDNRIQRSCAGGQLYIVDADGSTEPKQLTFEGKFNGSPIWLPISMDEILANAPTPAPPTAPPKPVTVAPPAPSSCPAEGVQITAPRAGAYFTQRYNYIIGTANINRFHHWKLEYSTDPNGGWQYLFDRDYPVNNDKLMMLDASTVPVGPYGLRLTVVDETGNYPEPCVVWFTNGY